MKKALLILAIALVPLFAQNIDWYTKNTSVATFEISTGDELRGFAQLVNNGNTFANKTIILTKDIVLSGNFTPIGNVDRHFLGIFDGQGYSISGLSVNNVQYAGLFGYVGANGQIKNVNVIVGEIRMIITPSGYIGSRGYAGGLAGYYESAKPIENSSVQGDSVIAVSDGTGSVFSGGLVGYIYNYNANNISNSYTKINIRTSSVSSRYSDIDCDYSYSGGLVGSASNASNITISNSYATGNVTSSSPCPSYSGGLVGRANSITITNSYTSGNISSSSPTRPSSYNYSLPSYYSYSGGLVGNSYTVTITNSYANGNVSAAAGSSYNTYHTIYSGGLVGHNEYIGSITNSYASGMISVSNSNSNTGGIFGYYNYNYGEPNTSVYYNSEGASVAIGSINSQAKNLGLSSTDLKKQASFIGWDFNDVWNIVENVSYPFLKALPPSGIYISHDNIEIEYIHDQTYAGTQIKPEPIVRLKTGNKPNLIKGTDYDLSYGENINVGTGTIKITGKDNYSTLLENITFNIIPKKITLENASAKNKIYDGNTTAEITGELYGVFAGDDVILNGIGTFADKDVGNKKTVTSDITLIGSKADNYNLKQLTGTLTANITPKSLDVTGAKVTNKIYDGGVIATITGEIIQGVLDADEVSINTISGWFYDANVGEDKPVTVSITLTGTAASNYSPPTITLLGTITAKQLPENAIASISSKTYTGSAITPAINALDGVNIITNSNYDLEYDNNIYVGTATITITGKGNYYGTATATFAINAKSLTNAMIQTISEQTYSCGDEIEPVTMIDGFLSLVKDKDYTVAYTDNTVFGTAKATITGIGNYTGIVSRNFSINKKELTVSEATVVQKTYDRTTTATIKDATLQGVCENDKDKVSLANLIGTFSDPNVGSNISVRTNMTLNGTAAGNYSLTQPTTLTGTITTKQLPENAIQTIADQTYTGSNITPAITAKDEGNTIANSNYDVSFSNNKNVGTANVSITGIGNYSGTATAEFTINPKPLANSMIQNISAQTYSCSKEIKPAVIVIDGRTIYREGFTLIEGEDYTFAYTNNTEYGTATVTIKGKNNYTGTASKDFEINKKELTVSGATISKIYDGTTTATITGATLEGVCENDDVSLENLTGIFNNANVGKNKPVSTDMKLGSSAANNYSLTQPTLTGTITPKQLPENAIQTIADQTYTGSNITPPITLKDGENTIANTNYDVSFSDNKNVGTANVSITGKGNYAGTATSTFKIVAGEIAKEPTPNPTPTLLTQATGNIHAYAAHNAIVLQNLPQNAKVQVYNISGKLISSKSLNQVNQGSDVLKIPVQTGVYIVKAGHQTLRIAVK